MKRNQKYGAIPTEVDGVRFASKGEARRYTELKLLVRAGQVKNLELQPSYKFVLSNGNRVCYPSGRDVTYRADFRYFTDDCRVVEDFKGMDTPASKIKRAMMKAFHNIDVLVTS